MEENKLSIGEIAKQLSINPKTIRYYEDIKLLPRPNRGSNNYRVYSKDTLNRLHFIKKAKSLGFTLKEIKKVLIISDRGNDPCEHIGEILKLRIVDLEKKLKELKELRTKLKKLEKEWSSMRISEVCNTGDLICPKIEKYF
jgi:MerR family transcriptional regulator, copper efflux regulator